MKNLFNSILSKRPRSNTFDMTHDVKMSGKMGNLYPCMIMDCVPGDKIKLGSEALIRFAPLIAPVMHRLNATIHYFFVPNRILWDNWESFITNSDTHDPPWIEAQDGIQTPAEAKFMQYFGVQKPVPGQPAEEISALPFAAYQMVYNEFYRDQNLITASLWEGPLNDGFNTHDLLLMMRKRSYMHDYFTAALPFAQKGNEVEIPGGEVVLDPAWGAGDSRRPQFNSSGTFGTGNLDQDFYDGGQASVGVGGDGPAAYDPDGTLFAKTTTINEFRKSMRLQEWLEKMARGGSRYIEQILTHFGVRSSDKRLQRPEYITGLKQPIVISEVLNTTGQQTPVGEEPGLPQGNMAGHAVSVGNGNVGTYFCEEHGYIIGILSISPLPAYTQGIPRHFLRKDPLEYYWPSFANIGEQEIKRKEVFGYQGSVGNETWGYIPRYSEYRYLQNRVAGDFVESLKYWHLAREFALPPNLSKSFIEVNADEFDDRIFAVTDPEVDNLYMHIVNKVIARRLMPVYGTPML